MRQGSPAIGDQCNPSAATLDILLLRPHIFAKRCAGLLIATEQASSRCYERFTVNALTVAVVELSLSKAVVSERRL